VDLAACLHGHARSCALGFEQLIERGQQLGASGLIERGPILLR